MCEPVVYQIPGLGNLTRSSHAMVASGEAYDTITAVCRNLEQRHAPAPSTA